MAKSAQVQKYVNRETLAVGTTRYLVRIGGYTDIGLQWIQHAAAGDATISLYAALVKDQTRYLADLDPATNPYWSALPSGFVSQPTAALGSEILPIADNAVQFLLVEIVVGTELTDFSLLVRSTGR